MAEITFGTDGWRSVIAEDFTFANVRSVAQAIAQHLKARNLAERGIVIGYDTRFLAENFAAAVAEVMAGNGIKSFICEKFAPTPAVAHAVTVLKAGGAVMLTASHNPPEYSGIKFIPAYAGPALPEDIDPIAAFLTEVLKTGNVKKINLEQARERGLLETIEPLPAYMEHVERLIDFDTIAKAGMKIVIDPMYGAGMGYLETILARHGCRVQAIHDRRDPLFGGSLPEPTRQHLDALKAEVQKSEADIGFALDGDADRLGVVDPQGRFFSPNEILVLFLEYLVSVRKARGAVARTVATTHMLDRIAASYGFEVIETPVGFKYIGKALRDQGAFLGGEESGGISIREHIPEKDGIFAALLFVEMLAKTQKTAAKLLDDLNRRFGPLYSERLDVRTTVEKKDEIVEKVKRWEPQSLAGVPVKQAIRVDGLKLVLANGSWCLVRPSGTEPVFRIYVEAASEAEKRTIQQEVKTALCVPL